MADILPTRKAWGGLRLLGLLLTIAGLLLATSVLAFASGWGYISVPGGVEIPMIVPGLFLLLVGSLLAWAGGPRLSQPPEKIDVAPIAEWVRTFERHQAELEFNRLSELYHGRSLVKYEPRTLSSRHEPAA